jgi:hypothetical protein
VHPDDVGKVTRVFARAAAGQTPKSIEFRWQNKQGEERWAGESIFPVAVAGAEGSIHTVQIVL